MSMKKFINGAVTNLQGDFLLTCQNFIGGTERMRHNLGMEDLNPFYDLNKGIIFVG